MGDFFNALLGGSVSFTGLLPTGGELGVQPGEGFAASIGRTKLHNGVVEFLDAGNDYLFCSNTIYCHSYFDNF